MNQMLLDRPAKVGAGTFGKGVKWSTVIAAAQRLYEHANQESESKPHPFTVGSFQSNPCFDSQQLSTNLELSAAKSKVVELALRNNKLHQQNDELRQKIKAYEDCIFNDSRGVGVDVTEMLRIQAGNKHQSSAENDDLGIDGALIILREFIRSDEYKNNVRQKTDEENKRFELIEKSLKPTEEQMRKKFDL